MSQQNKEIIIEKAEESNKEVEIKITAEIPRPKTGNKRPAKKVSRSNTTTNFDLKYFRGNTLASRRAIYQICDHFDVTKSTELAHEEAQLNKKNREQHLNLFQTDSKPERIDLYQQRREGYNLITGELYNDKPVVAISEKAANRIHSAR